MQRPNEIEDWDEEILNEIIEHGESNWLEFKRTLEYQEDEDTDSSESEWRHKLETEFTAFANDEGGTIIFGVTDGGRPRGISQPEGGFNRYLNMLWSDINPSVSFRTNTIELYTNEEGENQFAVLVHVDQADNKPVQTSHAAYYIRINESSQPMNRELVQSMYLRSAEQFNAKRDLEIQLEQFVDLFHSKYDDYDTNAEDPPNFSEIHIEELQDAINRFLRYSAYDQGTANILRDILRIIEDLESLQEHYHMYSRGETIAFEYGRRRVVDSRSDYEHINQGARGDLKEHVDDLYGRIRPLSSSDDLDFEL